MLENPLLGYKTVLSFLFEWYDLPVKETLKLNCLDVPLFFIFPLLLPSQAYNQTQNVKENNQWENL